ncbi:transposase [Streptomyces massasporeus]|uniref:transposase n=1 Tax=Streptomyces massasporeus TaxID=67324 RepID=UPI00368A4F98
MPDRRLRRLRLRPRPGSGRPRALHLPKSWTENRERCRTARVPDERDFATKGELARRMVLRALASTLPIAWGTADSAYGQDNRFRRLLEQSGAGPPRPVQFRFNHDRQGAEVISDPVTGRPIAGPRKR